MATSQSSPTRDQIIVADKVYIPTHKLSASAVRRGFERRLFDDRKCKKCDIFKQGERYSESVCGQCPAHKGMYRTWARTRVNGIDYIAFPSGNAGLLASRLNINFSNERVVDLRVAPRVRTPLRFTKPLFHGQIVNTVKTVNQVKLISAFWKKKRGLLIARAGSGKTVVGVRLTLAYGLRTLIMAHEMELLNQFMRTFREFTNVTAEEKRLGRQIIGIITKPSDLKKSENWDIVLTTYQRFITEDRGFAYLDKHVRGKFGVVIIDEVHRGNAESYLRVLNRIDPKFKVGLTATRERKDGLEFLIDQVIGPVAVEAEETGLTPEVLIHETQFKMDYEPQGMTAYTKITRAMAEDRGRNIQIVRQVFADLREHPNNSIVIPVLYVEHCHRLANLINRYAMYRNENFGENWPTTLALPYHARTNKKAVLAAARSRESRVIVAIRSKIAEGIDVPVWNRMYLTFPMNNFTNFYQLTQRILRPHPHKPQPILRFFADRIGLSLGCLNATWWNGVRKYKYNVSMSTQAQFDALVALNQRKGKRGVKHTQQKIGRSF